MLKYNLNKMGNSKLTKESTMIRKNIKHMTKEEEEYLKNIIAGNQIEFIKIIVHKLVSYLQLVKCFRQPLPQ